MIAPYVLHRHRRLWSDPDSFDPDRFMPERREAIDRYAYLPFGAGPRVCIGASLLAAGGGDRAGAARRGAAVRSRARPRVTPVQRVTLRPAGGLPMRIALRAASLTRQFFLRNESRLTTSALPASRTPSARLLRGFAAACPSARPAARPRGLGRLGPFGRHAGLAARDRDRLGARPTSARRVLRRPSRSSRT